MRMNVLVAGAALSVFLGSGSVRAQSADGELRCNIQGGFGVAIGSSRAVTCTFRRPGQPVEFYTGQTDNVGLDLGPMNAQVVTYSVSAAPRVPGVLQSTFVGPGFGAMAGAGISENALVGANGVALFPIPRMTATASTGFNISAGLNHLHLLFAGFEDRPDRNRTRRILRRYGLDDGTN